MWSVSVCLSMCGFEYIKKRKIWYLLKILVLWFLWYATKSHVTITTDRSEAGFRDCFRWGVKDSHWTDAWESSYGGLQEGIKDEPSIGYLQPGITSRPNPAIQERHREKRRHEDIKEKKLESIGGGQEKETKKEVEAKTIIEKEIETKCLNICFEWYSSTNLSIRWPFVRLFVCSKH